MSKWFTKLGCILTGWNYDILKNCSEASHKQLKKYTAALIILILLWGFTGYAFSERYIGTDWVGSSIVSLVFIIVILQIERQIILTVGKNRLAGLFRFFIAIIMAILGSSIIDQIIFKNDIDKQMITIVDQAVIEQLPSRLNVLENRISEIKIEMDSLEKISSELNDDINKNPNIRTYSTTKTVKKLQLDDGTYIDDPQTTTTVGNTPNPKIDQVKDIRLTINLLREQQKENIQKKLEAETNLRNELKENAGFLEELNAVITIITNNTTALLFYLIIFSFLICLELFIVVSKLGDTKCDYELIVEHQLETKINSLKELSKK